MDHLIGRQRINSRRKTNSLAGEGPNHQQAKDQIIGGRRTNSWTNSSTGKGPTFGSSHWRVKDQLLDQLICGRRTNSRTNSLGGEGPTQSSTKELIIQGGTKKRQIQPKGLGQRRCPPSGNQAAWKICQGQSYFNIFQMTYPIFSLQVSNIDYLPVKNVGK